MSRRSIRCCNHSRFAGFDASFSCRMTVERVASRTLAVRNGQRWHGNETV